MIRDPVALSTAQGRLTLWSGDGPKVIAGRDHGPLADWDVGVKDNIAVAGQPRLGGMAPGAALPEPGDATCVAGLRAAGAALLVGLNMDECALGGATDNPHHGRTDNPAAPGHRAGGSSGGSAAAVAAGVVRAALGTDTLGSIRIPASYCGVTGLKPTFGALGRGGILPLAPGFDCVGPIARRVGDLWPVVAAMAGPDPEDPDWTGYGHAAIPSPEPGDLRGRVFALPRDLCGVHCTEAVGKAFAATCAALDSRGAEVITVPMPGWRPAALRRAAFLLVEAEGAVALAPWLDRPGAISDATRSLLDYGARAPSAKLIAALGERRAAGAAALRVLAVADAILTPTTPHRAPRADAPVPADQADFTVLANAAGLPALALPVDTGGGRPASVQLTGRAFRDADLVALGMAVESALRD